MLKSDNSTRESFSGKLGIIAAAAGSAVGLGNVWRFPYITGENGGGAFLLIYLICVFAIGLPVMLSELVIGRRSQSNAFGSFRKLSPGEPWYFIGIMGIIAAFMILSFYSTVSGWTLEYIYQAAINNFQNKSAAQLNSDFEQFTSDSIRPVIWQLVFMLLTALIVYFGVKKGIEASTKILMPLLLLIIIIICIRSLSLPGAGEGLRFMFEPHFEDLSFKSILLALGQAAFSLSIGMGTLITYGSYVRKDTPLVGTAIQVASADTLIAVLSGVMIFPALFAFGQGPVGGPGLVFITLPQIFQSMQGGYFIGILFFILLAVAALTSTISVLEVVVAFLIDELKLKRLHATLIGGISISIIGVFCTLSFGLLKDFKIFNFTLFELMNYISANILLTFGALFIVIYAGWRLGKVNFIDEIKQGGNVSNLISHVLIFIVKYIAPIAIASVAIGAFFIEGLT